MTYICNFKIIMESRVVFTYIIAEMRTTQLNLFSGVCRVVFVIADVLSQNYLDDGGVQIIVAIVLID